MKIGHKIRQLREIKSLSQENMADVLKMSVTGYGKIERNEVDINIEKLQQVAEALNMKPEDILAFDQNVIFNMNGDNNSMGYHNSQTINMNFPEKLQQLYEDKIKLLEDKITYLEKESNKKS